MKKKVLGVIAFAAIAAVAGWNITLNENKDTFSDLALANIEALAQGESDEDVYNSTGCYAVWVNITCRGKDGNLHSFASESRP